MIKLNGRRGAFLLLFGLMFLAMGYALSLPMTPQPYRFLHDLLPWWSRSLLWGGAGLVALISAFVRDTRFTIAGYTALSIPLAERLASYALSWIIIPVDLRASILGTIVYGSLLCAVLIVASWPEPRPQEIQSMLPPDKHSWKRWWRK